jgi:hypothetical protein
VPLRLAALRTTLRSSKPYWQGCTMMAGTLDLLCRYALVTYAHCPFSFHAGAAPLQKPAAPVLTAADFDAEIQSGLLDIDLLVEGEDDTVEGAA